MNTSYVERYEYLDPPAPAIPDEVLGVPTDPLMRLGRALGTMAFIDSHITPPNLLSYGYDAKYSTDKALAIFPLIEKVQSGEEVTPEDVRPYRKTIKQLLPRKVRTADKFALVSVPVRRALNRKIEREFPGKIAPKLAAAVDYLPLAEPSVDFVSQFENPREQFVSEIALVANGIRRLAHHNAEMRGTYPDTVTAFDAGEGIKQAIERVISEREMAREHLPLLSHFLIDHMPDDLEVPSADLLAIAAPEIMYSLDAALPTDQTDPRFRSSIDLYPHPKRGLAQLFKRRQLDGMHAAGTLLLLSIRDLLPTEGQEVKRTFERIKRFFNV